jgi:protein phosphatase PTC1
MADGEPVEAGEDAPSKPQKFICYVTKRKFKTQEALNKHEEFSELYKTTLKEQELTLATQKHQLYNAVHEARRQITELDVSMAQNALHDSRMSDMKGQAEDRLSRCEVTYGLVQEKIEARRRVEPHVKPQIKFGEKLELTRGLTMSSDAIGWWGNKDTQEDRFLLDLVLAGGDVLGYVVMDGHTGSKCVDYMYASVPRTLERTLSSKPKPLGEEAIKTSVKEAIVLLEDEWAKLAKAHDLVDGTTFNLVLFFADKSDVNLDGTRQVRQKVICANVGDTRTLLSRRGMPLRLSEDHRPSRQSERLRIEEAGGSVQEINGIHRVFTLQATNIHGRMMHLGLSVSRSLGDMPLKQPVLLVDSRPEFKSFELTPDDSCVIIACDGVWDVLSEREACLIADQAREEKACASQRIVRRSFEKCSSDNLTCVVVYLDTEEVPATKRRRM